MNRLRNASVWTQRIGIGVVAALVAVFALRVGSSSSQSVVFRDLTAWLPNVTTGEVVLAHAGGGRGEIVARVKAAAAGEALVVAQNGSGAVVLNQTKGEVGLVDGITLTLSQKAPIADTGEGSQLVTSRAGVRVVTPSAVHRLDPVTAIPMGVVPLDAPVVRAVADDAGRVYGLTGDGTTVAVSDGVATVALPEGSSSAGVVAAGGVAYAIDRNGPSLRRLDGDRSDGSACLRGAIPDGSAVVSGGSLAADDPVAVVVDAGGGLRITEVRRARCTSLALGAPATYGTPVVTAELVYLPVSSTRGGEVIVVNIDEGTVVGRYGLSIPDGHRFDLIEKDGTVWFNDPDGTAAGVLGRDNVIIRIDKTAPAAAAGGGGSSTARASGASGEGGSGAGAVTGANGTRVPGGAASQGSGGSGASGSSGAGSGGSGTTSSSGATGSAGATGPAGATAPLGSSPSSGGASSDPNVAPAAPSAREGLVADFTYSARNVRIGQTVTFTDTSSGSPTAWTWEFGDGTFATGAKVTHSWSQAGSFTVLLRVEDRSASSVASVTITVVGDSVKAKPEADFRFSNARVEVGQPITFTDRSTGDPTEWQWNFGDGSGGSGSSITHAYSVPGLYEVILTVTNGQGSDSSAPALITVFDRVEAPVAVIGGGLTTTNVGQQVGYFSRSTGNPTQLTWSFGDGTSANGAVVQHAWTRAGSYTVSLTAANSAGSNTATATIVVNDLALAPVSRFTASQTNAEEGQAIRFQSLAINSPTSLAWDFGDGSTATGSAVTHAYDRAGTYQVRLRAANSAGADESTQTVTVVAQLPAPVAAFTFAPTTVTAGSPVVFTDESSGGAATGWTWDFGDGDPTVSQRNPTHRFDRVGIFVVRLTVVNAKGSSTAQRTVNVLPAAPEPAFTFSPAAPLAGQAVQFTDTSGGGAGATWLWNFGDGTTSTQRNPSKSYAANGSYDVRLTVTNASGAAFVVRRVEVNPQAPVAAFDFSPASPTIATPVVFRNTSTGGDASTIRWDFGDGSTSTQRNPTKTYATPGNYTVRLTMQNISGSSQASASVVVTVPAPVASFTTSGTLVAGSAVTFTNTSTNGPFSTVAWDFGDATPVAGTTNATHTYAAAGAYDVRLSVTNAGGTVSTTRRITVAAPISATFTVSSPRVSGSPITFTNTTPGGPFSSLSWDFGDGGTATGAAPTHTYALAGSYTVRLVAVATTGATDDVSQTVAVVPPAPAASFTFARSTTTPREVTFTSTSTGQPFSSIAWDFGGGATATGPTVTHTFPAGNSFVVRLTVTNAVGTATTTQTLTFVTPVANFTVTPGSPARTYTFTNTSTPAPPYISLSWNFGDGDTATGTPVSHTFDAAGTYQVVLTVVSSGGTDTHTVPVVVP